MVVQGNGQHLLHKLVKDLPMRIALASASQNSLPTDNASSTGLAPQLAINSANHVLPSRFFFNGLNKQALLTL